VKDANWTTVEIPDQGGRLAVITGATSGLGKEAARVLAHKGATVLLAVRNVRKGEDVVGEIRGAVQDADVAVRELDLARLSSVRRFAEGIAKERDRLDVLINNAGVMMCPYEKTEDGFEIQMGTNHLGHFALTGLLAPLLRATPGSRVVATSSIAHRRGKIDLADLNWETRPYNSLQAYADSKLANLYFAYELARRGRTDPELPTATAAHPGWTRTDLQRHSGVMRFLNRFLSQAPEKGVLPTLRAAVDDGAEPGDYFGPAGFFELHGPPVRVESTARSHDEGAARELWVLSENLTGVSF
jgi:NAD(P)-dependent dehydrogenase (short-subunit alcohol dehydrogenase family)